MQSAIAAVGKVHGIGPGWINAAAAHSFGDQLVPHGALDRAEVHQWQALTVRVASRRDLIRLKLAASTRGGDLGARHRQNLVELSPRDDELADATEWFLSTTSDPAAFTDRVERVIIAVRKERDAG